MKLRLVAVITALATVPMLAHAQQGGPPSNAPKPTKADAQKVVQIITSDKAKTQTYCDLDKLYDRMQAADQKNDSKTVESLGKQADVLASKLGPEYNKMMGGTAFVLGNPRTRDRIKRSAVRAEKGVALRNWSDVGHSDLFPNSEPPGSSRI